MLVVLLFGLLISVVRAVPSHVGKTKAPELTRTGPPIDENGEELPEVVKYETEKKSNKPNLILSVIDDWGYGDVGFHDKQIATPEMGRMAEAGIVLERFYSGSTCTPSRAMMMTGRYNIRNGMQDSVLHSTEPRGLPLDEKLLPGKLRDVGYATAGVGKWHLGMYRSAYLPERRGFDHWFGIYTGGGSHTAHFSVSQPFTVRGIDGTQMWQGSNLYEDEIPVILASEKAGLHTTHLYSAKALEYVQAMSNDISPWFLFLSYQAIHDPITVGDPKYIQDTTCATATVTEDTQINDELRPTLCGMVAEIDDGLKSLRLGLEANGQWDNTILFLISDNGGVKAHGSSNYPLRGEKGTYYEGGVRVPALVAGGLLENMLSSRGKNSRRVIDINLHLVDLHATLLELGGGATTSTIIEQDKNKPLDGTSFWSLLISDENDTTNLSHDRAILINLNSDLFAGSGALIQGRYKLIVNPEPNEAAIYSKVRKALGAHSSNLDLETLEKIIRQAHHDVLGETSVHLFDIRANPSEIDLGNDCTDTIKCRDLYELSAFVDVRTQLEATWARFQAQAVPSTFAWEDDGPLADPALFNGFWAPWRDGDGQPKAHYFGTKVLDGPTKLQEQLSEQTLVDTTSLAHSSLNAFKSKDTLLVSSFLSQGSAMQFPYTLIAIASFTVGLFVSQALSRRRNSPAAYFERLP
mmetsp:Transcript_13209/g.19766  ORF Transcript_13209/g.19766 Transcript_13209/m.19766 type:complete len:693 (-) Transcript_13209:3728-5806(-)